MTKFASYASVSLPTPGKKGILKKLDNDYFEIIVGAFGAFGNGGWLYDEKTSIDYFENNPEFLNLIKNRRLRSEWGHPRREAGMTDMQWLQRVHEIAEPNWSSHIRALHLSSNTVKDERGRNVVAVIGEVTPCGPNAEAFRRCLENPDEDVSYSVRSFARKNFSNGRKYLKKIVTFDSVWEPGIKAVNKFNTPSMESSQLDISNDTDVGIILDQAEFHLESISNAARQEALTNESFESNDDIFQIIDSLTTSEVALKTNRQYAW